MKLRKIILQSSLILVLIFAMAACATFKRDAYRSLAFSASSYDTVMSGMASLYVENEIDQEVWDETVRLGRIWKTAHNEAADALAAYAGSESPVDKERYLQQMQIVSTALANLINYARPYLREHDKEVP